MKVIAFHNLKGGVGKTAAAVNIAQLAADSGVPTLLWDMDPQAASSWYFAPQVDAPRKSAKVAKVIRGKTPVGYLISPTASDQLDLIPADPSFRNIDRKLSELGDSGTLGQWLRPLGEDYALVVLDCPPSFSELAEQVYASADRVYVPLIPTWLSLNSWDQMDDLLAGDKNLRKKRRPFFSMVDRRKRQHLDVLASPPAALKKLLAGYIPYAAMVEKMGEHRQALCRFAPSSPAALAYRLMWEDMRKDLKL